MPIARSRRGPFESWVLTSTGEDSILEVLPERGGLVSRARLRGREILYMDEESLVDTTKNVRGGIPVLFPIAGKLPNGQARVGSVDVHLPQHGFARSSEFRIVTDKEPHFDGMPPPPEVLTIEAVANDATRRVFPFEWILRLRYAITGGALRCEATVKNCSNTAMPFVLGFHPYLAIPDSEKGKARIEVAATKFFDNRTGSRGSYQPPDLIADEVDIHVLDPSGGAARIVVDNNYGYRLDYGGFPVVVIWTLKGRDFICLEPWSAAAGALASGEGLEWLSPGVESHRMFFLRTEEPLKQRLVTSY